MINNLMGMTFMDMLPAIFMSSTVLNVLCCYYAWCRIATLTKRVETLENENATLKTRVETLENENATLKKDNEQLFILFDKTIGIVEAVEDDLDVRELLNTKKNIIKVNQRLDGNNSRLRPTLLNLFVSPEFDLLKEPANNFAHRDRLMTPSAQTKASTRVTNGSFGDVLDGSPYSLEQFNFLSNLAHGASPDTRKQLLDCNTTKQRLKKNTKATAVNTVLNERLAAAAEETGN